MLQQHPVSNIIQVEETSPIVQRTQRRTQSALSNHSNSVILVGDSDGDDQIDDNHQIVDDQNHQVADNGDGNNGDNPAIELQPPEEEANLQEELQRITAFSQEAENMSRQVEAHIQNVTNLTGASSSLSSINHQSSSSLNQVGPGPSGSNASSPHLLPPGQAPSSIQPPPTAVESTPGNSTSSHVPDTSLLPPPASLTSTPVIPRTASSVLPTATSSATEVSPYFGGSTTAPTAAAQSDRLLNASAAEFQGVDPESPELKTEKKDSKKKGNKAKKRKAVESVEDENDEGSCCTICFEAWSNSGEHRIASLKCGHFFGYTCIEKWLRGSGSSCPNCNEKSTKKDIRVHYVAKLKAIDTSEKDRALADLEKEKIAVRELQLRNQEYLLKNKLLQEEMEKLQKEVHQYRKFRGDLPPALQSTQNAAMPTQPTRLVYQRRFEIVRGNEKTCRVLAYSEYNGMLLISQPSFTALAPGYGVRQFNVLDMKVGNFVSLCKDQIRDLSFSQVSPHLLLSCGHDRSVRITNTSNGHKVVEFAVEQQVWACDWAANNDYQIFLGTNKGTILIHDTREPTGQPQVLTFPRSETKPIIGLRCVPAKPEAGFPHAGFLVMTLTSLWFWFPASADENSWESCKLNIEQRLLWSLDFDHDSFLVLVGCKPSPLASHLVLELNSTMIDSGRAYTVRPIMVGKGGSYNIRSFLRSSLLPAPNGQVHLAFSKGTGQNDHKVVIQEVGSDRVMQELKVDRPIVDIKQMKLNDERYLALLGETELTVYKWNPVN
eukprot:TRINITY_DN7661_c0_g1_i11.p1 TRINITY_DN7661_c0_g1~~TRINITY_DN7661_c0_g1_i11.p1  ORF type:complete len:783 (-),score=136.21 TRINITY_DN7661_c0_g1_i11:343-2664(-)